MSFKDKRFLASMFALAGVVIVAVWYFSQSSSHSQLEHSASTAVNSEEVGSEANTNKNTKTLPEDSATVAQEQEVLLEFIDEAECTTHFENLNVSSEGIKQAHYQRLANYLQMFDRRARYDDMLLFGELVGLTVDETKRLLFGFDPIPESSKRFRDDSFFMTSAKNRKKEQMTNEEEHLLRELSQKSNIDSYITAFEEGRLATDKSYISQSPLGVIIKRNSKFDRAEIERLVSVGLEVDFDAIAYAVDTGKSRAAIEYLTQLYDGDLHREWNHNEYSLNLVLAAARKKRLDLVDYFSSKGVKKQTKQSILDVLPSPETPSETEDLQQLVTLALEDGQRPYFRESEKRLNAWLPEEVKETYQHQLQIDRTLPPALNERLDSFKAWHDGITAKIAAAQTLETRCLQHHEMSLDAVVQNRAEQETSAEGLSYFEKTRYLELEKTQYRELLKEQAKQANEQAYNEDESESPEIAEDVAKQISDALLQLGRFARVGNLEGFLQTYDEIESITFAHGLGKREEIEDLSMSIALSSLAYDIALAFVKQIMRFPDNMVLYLYRIKDPDKLKQFVDLGADLNFSSAGENILTRVLTTRPTSEMVSFLLEQDVSTKPSRLGLDALDIALNDLRTFKYSKYKKKIKSEIDKAKNVALIIRRKHPIEASHRHRVHELNKVNPKALEVTSTILPKLTINFKAD